MDNTGRLKVALPPVVRRLCYGTATEAAFTEDLELMTQVDRAHVVMLAEQGLLVPGQAAALLREIDRLRNERFAALRGRPASRGLYLMYEDYLIEALGQEVGGNLHQGRSRNDLNATVFRLRLRRPYLDLLQHLLGLWATLLRRAQRHADVVMPVYTHYQAALPVTYGHYLAGVAGALGRDVVGLFEAGTELGCCPLGAGAVGGTSLPIAPLRTARLLGFDRPAGNSIDAVASRDLVLRVLAAAAIAGVTLSRLATDLLLWTTAEFGFLRLSDRLVGSSSMMPQKRNPFLLEHVQGRSASALGAFAAAAGAMRGAPFTNSIAVGTEAVAYVWGPLQDTAEAVALARLVVAGTRPCATAMRQRAVEGYVCATELANRLMRANGLSFRLAHRTVGGIVRSALDQGGEPLEDAARRWSESRSDGQGLDLEGLDPVSVAGGAAHGGGPGGDNLRRCLETGWADWQNLNARCSRQMHDWQNAAAELDSAVRCLTR